MDLTREAAEAGAAATPAPEHFDVLIVGAGISGIDAAHHLQQRLPGKRFALLERQESFGGTWRTHTYPGIRSDSDLYTFGFKWKPWTGVPIATAAEILKYLDEALDEQDIRRHIRYRHGVERAAWSSDDRRWTLDARNLDTGETVRLTCSFLWMCQGYYRHAQGYTPDWPGLDDYRGRIVHPQTWPDDLDYAGKSVLVIGSGATAATLIPAIADACGHVTMLQRSPTWFYARPNNDELADTLRALDIPQAWLHEIMRRKYLSDQQTVTRRAREDSTALAAELIAGARAHLGDDFDVATHFTPSYRPWRQRLAVIPDGDLFKAMRAGKASVETGEIECFTSTGVRLKSGGTLDADIIITATGFDLCVLGDIAVTIDGRPFDFAACWTWRGMLFSGAPNFAWVFGYLRTSWTMRADLVADFICRLLGHMDATGAQVVTPQLREADREMTARPFIDPENFNAGYILRSLHLMPKQGDRAPWLMTQDYYVDRDEFPAADLNDGTLVFR